MNQKPELPTNDLDALFLAWLLEFAMAKQIKTNGGGEKKRKLFSNIH